jgi:uncharacterized protein (TIGR02217 family)
MSFYETRLDECVAHGFQAVPAYKTQIANLDSGKEQRDIKRTRARRKYSAVYQNFTEEEFAELLATFHSVYGSGHAFRFKDWTDYEVTDGALGTTPGANQTPAQLVKVYTFGAATISRTINKPNAVGFTLYQNGVAKAGTLDTTTGLFTPTTNWTAGATLTWTGTFDVPVRFANDDLASAFVDKNAITTNAELIEVFL